MIEGGEEFSFTLEAGKPIGIERKCRGKDLDRDFPFQLRVDGAVDLAHSASPELCGDLIATEASTWAESHVN
jgi:hypothetical protein